MAQNSVKALAISSILSSAINAGYAPLNGAGFSEAPFFIRIVNASSAAVTISYDGVTDNEFVPANSVFELPCQANAQPASNVALFSKNTIVYVKGVAGTGNVYLSAYYV